MIRTLINKLSYSKAAGFFLFIFFITGCKKFLEIPPPKALIESSNVFSSDATANAAILGIYAKMINDRGFPYRLSLHTGLLSDELKNYSTDPDIITFYTNSLNSQNSYLASDFWSPAYSYIYSANSILEGVANSNAVSPLVKNQLIGEAKFIRAFWYFNLVNLFGDVPLVTTTDYISNSTSTRTPVSDIYKQIITDLKDAESLLNVNYVGTDGLAISTERVRPNKFTASALLSRVYLYTKDWTNAELEATSVINNSLYSLPAIDGVFLKNSAETIWALQPAAAGSFSTPEGSNYILTSIPSTQSIQNATISQNLINAFDSNDVRKKKWIGTYSSYTFPYKYKVVSGTSLKEYSIVLRLAEQHLIRAEARAQQSHISEGLQDVNKIRNRAGLSDTTTTSKDQLLDIILHERQVELFSEYGQRWFDLKRTGKVDLVMSTVTPQKGGAWNSYKSLLPLPQTELNNDPNLKQNDGYQ